MIERRFLKAEASDSEPHECPGFKRPWVVSGLVGLNVSWGLRSEVGANWSSSHRPLKAAGSYFATRKATNHLWSYEHAVTIEPLQCLFCSTHPAIVFMPLSISMLGCFALSTIRFCLLQWFWVLQSSFFPYNSWCVITKKQKNNVFQTSLNIARSK